MTKIEIAALSFKVLSIYAFIIVIDNIYFTLGSITRAEDHGANLALIVTPQLLLVLSGIILWFIAPRLASSVFKTPSIENAPNASLSEIQTVAFSVVGIFLLAISIPELVSIIVVYNTMWVAGSKEILIKGMIVLSIKIILGLWLLLGSSGLVKFIRSTRRD
jgi:hypothetical protein